MKLENFPTHHKGDTFDELDFRFSVKDSEIPGSEFEPIDLTGYSVKMQVRYNNKRGNIAREFDTDDNGLEILTPAEGLIRFKKQIITLRGGTYYYEMQFTSPDGDVKTYLGGYWIIEEDGTV